MADFLLHPDGFRTQAPRLWRDIHAAGAAKSLKRVNESCGCVRMLCYIEMLLYQ